MVGRVFRFVSSKDVGAAKYKFHVEIDLKLGLLLFINSEPFEGSMAISRSDWPDMPKDISHISCNSVVRYRKSELLGFKPESCGRLSDACLERLLSHVRDSFVMPMADIDHVVRAISDHFR